MAFTGITATEAEIDQKSGAGVDTNYTDTMKTQALLQAESFINNTSRYNWSDNYGTLNVDVKHAITQVTASLVAIEAIKYNMKGEAGTGFSTLIEAEDMINTLWAIASLYINLFRDQKVVDFMKNA